MTSFLLAVAICHTGQALPWKQFESPAGRFVVNFPGPVKEVDETVDNAYGRVRYRAAYTLLKPDGFHVAYDDHPKPADAQKFLIGHWEKMLALDRTSIVIGRELTTWRGFPALEGRFYRYVSTGRIKGLPNEEMEFPIARVRLILVGERLYQLLVLSVNSKSGPANTERFWESFRLYEPAKG